MWNQIYNPLGNTALSTIAAAIPVVTLLVLIASGKVKAHLAAIIALIVVPFLIFSVWAFGPIMSRLGQSITKLSSKTASLITESIDNAEAVRLKSHAGRNQIYRASPRSCQAG